MTTGAVDDGVLACAEDAYRSVGALLELLNGCPPDYKLSAGLFLGLLVSVRANLENVVEGVAVSLGDTAALMLTRPGLHAGH